MIHQTDQVTHNCAGNLFSSHQRNREEDEDEEEEDDEDEEE
jgi:hypothetical protein